MEKNSKQFHWNQQQGYTLSPFLFITVLKLLDRAIRRNKGDQMIKNQKGRTQTFGIWRWYDGIPKWSQKFYKRSSTPKENFQWYDLYKINK